MGRPILPAAVQMLLPAALAIAVVLVLVGCSGGPLAEAPSDRAEPPQLGACRDLTPQDVAQPTNDSDVVECSEDHTAETFLVSTLPASTGDGYSDKGHGRHVHEVCSKAFQKFLGGDESLALRTQLSWAWFRASEDAWEKGVRWFRCDVVGGPAEGEFFRDLPTTAKALLAKEESSKWMTCAQGEQFAGSAKVPCSEPHQWRAVTAVKIGKPADTYPGDRVSEVRARDNCSDWVGAWMNYPVDYEYGYTIFGEAEWQAGNRRAVCWAKTDK